MAAAGARAAPSRSSVVARGLVHAAQVVGLLVLLPALAESPWVAATAAPSMLRVAASLLAPQPICFIMANVIVIILARLFASDAASFSPTTFADASGSPSSNSNGDAAPQKNAFLEFLAEMTRTPTPTPNTEAELSVEEVFEDKHAVHVKTKVRAQPPRRTMSEKTGDGGAAGRTATATAASTELRRAKSENGRRRQQRRSTAAEAPAPAPAELGTDDAEAFRQVVEAFIAKQQTWFHREESLVIARAAGGGGGGEGGPAIAGAAAAAAAAVAVK